MRGVSLHLTVLAVALCGAGTVAAQPADTVVTEAVVLARFKEAHALAVDPAGLLYIADAGADAVLQLGPTGTRMALLGGPGTGEGEFDNPADIDPTNGLVWVVADAGNSRLQRFSRTLLYLESIPVARIDRFTPGSPSRVANIGREVQGAEADGRPIAVVTSSANEIFAIDGAQGLVLKWDASRRLERAIGGFDAGEGALGEPVALAVAEELLFVADQGQDAVLVYDHFGGYVRTLAPGRAVDVRGLAVSGDDLWIVLPHRLLVYGTRGRLRRVIDVNLGGDEPLEDLARFGDWTYLLTPTRLFRLRL